MPEARAIRLGDLALARLEAALDLVDHIGPALAADQAVGAMPAAQRFQRVTDFHLKESRLFRKAVFDRPGRANEWIGPWNRPRPSGTRRFLGHGGHKCQSEQGVECRIRSVF